MQEPRKTKKGLIITLSVIGGLLIVGGIAALIYFTSGPSKAETAKQLDVTQDAVTAEVATIAEMQKAFKNKTTLVGLARDATAAVEKTKFEKNVLSQMRPVTKGEGEKLFDEYSKKVGETNLFHLDIAQAIIALNAPVAACAQQADYIARNDHFSQTYYKRLVECTDALKGARAKIDSPEFQAYTDKLIEAYTVLSTELADVQTSSWGTPEGGKKLNAASAKADTIISEAQTAFLLAITTREADTISNDAYRSLSAYLTK